MRMTCKDCIHCDVCLLCKEINADKAVRMFDFDCPDFRGKADFVEVVRCKDCKRFLEYADGKKRIEGADGDCYARMMHSCDEQFWGVCFDDFCSFWRTERRCKAMNKCETCKCNKVCDHYRFGFENCDNYISEDCVEVVRCRDCKYRETRICAITGNEMLSCNYSGFAVKPTHYCSYGERLKYDKD